MNFSRFWPWRRKKGSSSSETLSFDLLYQLSYMSAISAAGIPRSQIFELGSKLPCSSAKYIQEITTLSEQMRYDYAIASRMVGESTKNEAVKSLLLRLASSLASGEPERSFLAQEAVVQAEAFQSDYERGVESLRKWTEAYAALVVSAALIVMVAAVSMLIYPVATGFTVALTVITAVTAVMGAWMVHAASPKEVRIHTPSKYCRMQLVAEHWEKILAPLGGAVAAIIIAATRDLGLTFVAGGVCLIPIGVMGVLLEYQIGKKDRDISTFLRSLGNIASATGITMSQAVGRLDLRSTSALVRDVKKLRARLNSRLEPELCWRRFALDTGSETIYRSVKMFQDATRLGGDPEEVGERSSLLARSLDFLRAKRGQVSSSFGMLAMGIHAAIVGLLVFVTEVITVFAQVVANVYEQALKDAPGRSLDVFSFSFSNVGLLKSLTLPCLFILAGTTAFAANSADGGTRFKLYLYLGLTLCISGAAMVAVPYLTNSIFSSITIN